LILPWLKAEESGSFLKKRTKKLLQIWAEPNRGGRSQNTQKFFASFFQKRRPCFGCPGARLTLCEPGILLISSG
jgi:hypothetical protein